MSHIGDTVRRSRRHIVCAANIAKIMPGRSRHIALAGNRSAAIDWQHAITRGNAVIPRLRHRAALGKAATRMFDTVQTSGVTMGRLIIGLAALIALRLECHRLEGHEHG
jgi:hypothetical protein